MDRLADYRVSGGGQRIKIDGTASGMSWMGHGESLRVLRDVGSFQMILFHLCYLPPHATQFSLRCGCRIVRLENGYVHWLACAAHVGELAGSNGIAALPVERAPLPGYSPPVADDDEGQPPDWRLPRTR